MRKRIIEVEHNDEIRREIGDRLQARQRANPELPADIKEKVDELRRLEEGP